MPDLTVTNIYQASRMANNSFHYFVQLPVEIRLLIWELCLPYRTAELDPPWHILGGEESRQICNSVSTMQHNAQIPAIASINSESRQVALRHGFKLERDTTYLRSEPSSIWVQPRRDVFHSNWVGDSWVEAVKGNRPECEFNYNMWEAEEHGMQQTFSVVADMFHPFNLMALLDPIENASSPWIRTKCNPALRYHCHTQIDTLNEDLDCMAKYIRCDGLPRTLDVAIVAVSLHITRDEALKSGLFGLLGDAPVQMVDVKDTDRLGQFENLFQAHALEKEPGVQALFGELGSSRFLGAVELWTREAEWLILGAMWRCARDDKEELLGDPEYAWTPYLLEREIILMSKYLPNESHPWVKRSRQLMPKLRPRIMVRCCTNQCYIKERLGDVFD